MPEDSAKYETSDVHHGGVVWVAGGVAALMLVAFVGIWALMCVLHRATPDAEKASRLAMPQSPPPQPRLQLDEVKDLQEMRAANDEELRTYGWVNRDAGVVRIPIERAIELTAIRGLPARKPANGEAKPEGAP